MLEDPGQVGQPGDGAEPVVGHQHDGGTVASGRGQSAEMRVERPIDRPQSFRERRAGQLREVRVRRQEVPTEGMLDPVGGDVDADAHRPVALQQGVERRGPSVDVGERIQREDLDICESVQRGLQSRAYNAGRLSVRRAAGVHLFHRLLYGDLKIGLA